MRIFFDVEHLYYFPHFYPVSILLQKEEVEVFFVFHQREHETNFLDAFIKAAPQSMEYTLKKTDDTVSFYNRELPDWIVFGNSLNDGLHPSIKTALIYHGVGIKACYYDRAHIRFHVRFVEGEYRFKELAALFPKEQYE